MRKSSARLFPYINKREVSSSEMIDHNRFPINGKSHCRSYFFDVPYLRLACILNFLLVAGPVTTFFLSTFENLINYG